MKAKKCHPNNRLALEHETGPEERGKKSWMPGLIKERKTGHKKETVKTVTQVNVNLSISSMSQTQSHACLSPLESSMVNFTTKVLVWPRSASGFSRHDITHKAD